MKFPLQYEQKFQNLLKSNVSESIKFILGMEIGYYKEKTFGDLTLQQEANKEWMVYIRTKDP